MTIPSLDTIVAYTTICFAIFGALLAAIWLSMVIWTFRDMRARSRDPFAQILATLVVALLPGIGLIVYLILRPPETLAQSYERALEEEALLQEIEERPACPGCSRTVERNWMLCPHCHTRLRKACPDCNSIMDLHWNICPFCGNDHIDPYHVGPPLVLAEDIVAEEDARSESVTDDEYEIVMPENRLYGEKIDHTPVFDESGDEDKESDDTVEEESSQESPEESEPITAEDEQPSIDLT